MKVYLKRLKRILRFNDFVGNFYLIGLGVILGLLVIIRFNILYLIIFILYLLYLFIKSYKYAIVTIILFLFLLLNLGIRYIKYNKKESNTVNLQGVIVSVKEKTNSNQIIIKCNGLKYLFYDETKSLKLGDNINVRGNLSNNESNHIPYLFNYSLYLKENNIKGVINNPEYKKINSSVSIYTLNRLINDSLNARFKGNTASFLKALLVGETNTLGEELSEDIRKVGIGHLFVISGLHMNVLAMIITKILKLFKVKTSFIDYIIIFFFIIYYFITLGMVSILRVLLTFILSTINKKNKLLLSSLDIYIISIIFILLVNPYYLVNYSFLLTYIISTSLVIISPLLKFKGFKGSILNNIIMSVNSILVTLPIIINISPTINFLSIIYNLFYIPFISYILLPFSIIVLIFSFLSPIYELLLSVFIKSTSFLSNINLLNISFSSISIILPVIYYLLYLVIVLLLINKIKGKIRISFFILFSLIIIIWCNYSYINMNDEIYFLDLPKGESTVIIKAFNEANILIDTGENVNNDLELFLKKKGIKRLDYVFISHSDSDHNGRLPYLIKAFKIKNIVISKYDEITYEICIRNNYKGNIIKVKADDKIIFKDIVFEILSPSKNYNSPNNNSVVMKTTVFNKKILFTGDIEKEVESTLLNKVTFNIDIYKIPHHGSLTSSSSIFVNKLNYKYAVCMSGYRNTFGLPNMIAINRYEKEKVLLTKNKRTIYFKKKWFKKNIALTDIMY